MMNRRHFLIGTGAVVATAALAPKLILPERTLVANAQGIILGFRTPVIEYGEWRVGGGVDRWVLPYAKIKWPLGKVVRAWAGHSEIKWDQRRLSFQFSSLDGILEIWNLPIDDPVHDEFVLPNFVGLVERSA